MPRPLTSDPASELACALRIGAIVLAAGLSSRMGRFKPLLQLDGRPLISHAIDHLRAASPIHPFIIVTGHHADLVHTALAGTPGVELAHNPHYAMGGMLSSIKTGLASIGRRCDAVLLALGDHPLVLPQTVSLLLKTARATSAKVIKPTCNGQRGHPILIDASLVQGILDLPPDATLKAFLQSLRGDTLELPTTDLGVLLDVDTPEDFRAAEQLYASRAAHEQEQFAIGV